MFADTFHTTLREAMEEAGQRRSSSDGGSYLTNVERSPYGGFRVRSIPAELYVDQLIEGSGAGGMLNHRGLSVCPCTS